MGPGSEAGREILSPMAGLGEILTAIVTPFEDGGPVNE